MLPHTLQCAERPAESLLSQAFQRLRRLGPRDGVLFVGDLIAYPSRLEREVLIFGQRVGSETARAFEQFAAPCAHRAGHDRDAVQGGERAPVEILRDYVFERLPASDEVDAIADLGVTRDGADFWFDEEHCMTADRVGLTGGGGCVC